MIVSYAYFRRREQDISFTYALLPKIAWIFNSVDPTVDNCRMNFKKEFALVIQKSKKKWARDMQAWLATLH
jgi:hypothetical protein